MIRKIGSNEIRLLSLGEGQEFGIAAKYAQKLLERKRTGKVLAVDLLKPNYVPPQKLAFIEGNALAFLERLANSRPNSVRIIRDDFFFHFVFWGGKHGSYAELSKEIGKIQGALKNGSTFGILQKMHFSEEEYCKNIVRALVPGGRFIATTFQKGLSGIVSHFSNLGFRVSSRELTQKEVELHGSAFAKSELKNGEKVFRIIAVKPRLVPSKASETISTEPKYLSELRRLRREGLL